MDPNGVVVASASLALPIEVPPPPAIPSTSVAAELVAAGGGVDAVCSRAQSLYSAEPAVALQLLQFCMSAAPGDSAIVAKLARMEQDEKTRLKAVERPAADVSQISNFEALAPDSA